MKKNYIVALLLSSFFAYSQEIIFSEDFQDEEKVLSTWRYSDEDRDGFIWSIVYGSNFTLPAGFGDENNSMFGSTGYSTMPGHVGATDPDNLLISPLIELPADRDCILEYKIGNYYEYFGMDNNYQLFIIEEDEDYFPTLEPITQRNFNGTHIAFEEKVDLSAYKGKKIHLFFRHHNSFFQWYLLLDDIVIKTKEDLSTTENNAIGKGQIYPNPTSDILNLDGFEGMKSYQILDMNSRQIEEGKATNNINVEKLPIGVYYLLVNDKEGQKSFKFIKK
ncbi:MAG: T9SS type A sorting domain-containing protein [Cruoricaptor ignavus]|nr:T9SS type A sorting domain-containing protein [Cruoricaptor ignavus]